VIASLRDPSAIYGDDYYLPVTRTRYEDGGAGRVNGRLIISSDKVRFGKIRVVRLPSAERLSRIPFPLLPREIEAGRFDGDNPVTYDRDRA